MGRARISATGNCRESAAGTGTAWQVGAAGEAEEAANLNLSLRDRRCYDVQGFSIKKAPLGAGTWDLGPGSCARQWDGRCWRREVAVESPESRARTGGCLVLSCAVLCFAVLRYAVVLQCNQRQRFTAPACKWKQSCMILRLPLSSLTMCSSRRRSGWLAGWLSRRHGKGFATNRASQGIQSSKGTRG